MSTYKSKRTFQSHAAPSFSAVIFVAGDVDVARQVCREHTLEVPLCVNLAPVDYVYTGGMESGVRVELINYPRFDTPSERIYEKALDLAYRLMDRLCQVSCSVMTPSRTVWLTCREEDQRRAGACQRCAAADLPACACNDIPIACTDLPPCE